MKVKTDNKTLLGNITTIKKQNGLQMKDVASKMGITPESLRKALDELVIRQPNADKKDEVILQSLRKDIDKIDDDLLNLLAKRMNISEEIGKFKKKHKVTVLQKERWKQIQENHINKGKMLGLNVDSVKEIFEIIHKDSIDRQL